MTKSELMEMAEKHGATSYRNRADTKNPAFGFSLDQLSALYNTILERAAVELSTYGVIQDMGGADAAEIVRSLKLPTN